MHVRLPLQVSLQHKAKLTGTLAPNYISPFLVLVERLGVVVKLVSFVAFPYSEGLATPLFHPFDMDEAYRRVYAAQGGLLVILKADQALEIQSYCLKN